MLTFVFGAGSSRGALQAGALQALFEAEIKPDMVVGSSIGALNAAFLAQEPTLENVERLQKIYIDTNFQDVFTDGGLDSLRNIVKGNENLFDPEGVEELIATHLTAQTFSELKLPCYITTTDIDQGELVVFGDDGDQELMPVLLSSTAMLPLFPPHETNGRLLGDGGLKAMLPIGVSQEKGATTVLALNITTQLRPYDDRNNMLDMLLHVVDLLCLAQVEATISATEQNGEIPIHVLNLQPENYTAVTDMDNMEALIHQGYHQTQQALDNGAFADLVANS